MLWIYNIPEFPLGVGITLAFVAVACSGLWLTQRFILPLLQVRPHHTDFTGVILGGILVIYGLAVALIAVSVWENYAGSSTLVSNEATAIAMLYRDCGAYPDSTRDRLHTELKGYTDYVIRQAWPQQRRGKVAVEGVHWMNRVQNELFRFTPTSDAQKILHAEALHAFNHLVEARRLRLDAVRTGLPPAMWTVVLLGALIALGATFLFHVDSVRHHYAMVSLLASLMGLVVFLILIYDAPFLGTHGVGPDAYELVLAQIIDL